MAGGMNVISGALEKFPQVGEHVGIAVDAENAAAGKGRSFNACSRPIKGGHSLFLGVVSVEQTCQMRQLQNFAHMFWHIAQLQIAARLASAGQGADDRAQTAAVNKADLAQMQNDGAPVAQQPGHVSAQRLALASRNNSSIAMNNGDASNLTSFEREAQRSPIGLRTGPQNRHIISISGWD